MNRTWLYNYIGEGQSEESRQPVPELRLRQRAEALQPLLILHSFRFIGLAFLVPGVVSTDLPTAFAHSAAYRT